MNMPEKDRFRELLQGFETAVLITHGGKASFRARPMVVAGVDYNCDLWFVTNRDSAKVHEIQRDREVQVVCQNGWSSCVCLTGRASLDNDRAKLLELWNPSCQAWFPKGVNDPDLVLIHLAGEHGEYWDNTGTSQINFIYQTIKAIVTGERPTIPEKQHGQVKFVRSGYRSNLKRAASRLRRPGKSSRTSSAARRF